jgi:hypothetical protein
MRPLFKKRAVITASALLAVVAVLVFGSVFVRSAVVRGQVSEDRTVGVPTLADQVEASITLSSRSLASTTFQTNNTKVTASCASHNCFGTARVFSPSPLNVVCPAVLGGTCTYYIDLESQVEVSTSECGLFKFLVDGIAPNPGPTDSKGFFVWLNNDPQSGVITPYEARSYAVVATVKNNTSANQAHLIEVDIGCQATSGSSCAASIDFATLQIGVYRP